MKEKILVTLIVILSLTLAPSFSLAETDGTKPTGDRGVNRIEKSSSTRPEFATGTKVRKELATNTKERKEVASGTKERLGNGTSTKQEIFNQIKNRAGEYIEIILSHLEKSVSRLTNIIERLKGPNSILVKLEKDGKNIEAIETKLDEAKNLLDEATKEIGTATKDLKELVAKATTTQTINAEIKKGYSELKTTYKDINAKIRAAQVKITEAVRLIKEIPGVNKINKGEATTTSTSTNN